MSVKFGLAISKGNSFSHWDKRILVNSKHSIGLEPNYVNKVNKKTTRERKQVQVVFIAHELIYKSLICFDWWNSFRPIVFAECLDFTTACRHGPH